MSERLDVLNRDVFVENLVQLVNCLSDKEQGCCFGLDGAWGSGKSFVIDKFEEKLKCIQSEKTKTDTYFVFHYDCWKYDYYDEPAIAIIAAMLDATDKELSMFSEGVENAKRLGLETVRKTLKTIAGELCKNKIGIDLVDLASNILEEHDKEREQHFDRMVKFNKKTLEYLVYEKSSKRIISYFLPKWTAYNNGTISSKKEWIKEALEYALRHISRK